MEPRVAKGRWSSPKNQGTTPTRKYRIYTCIHTLPHSPQPTPRPSGHRRVAFVAGEGDGHHGRGTRDKTEGVRENERDRERPESITFIRTENSHSKFVEHLCNDDRRDDTQGTSRNSTESARPLSHMHRHAHFMDTRSQHSPDALGMPQGRESANGVKICAAKGGRWGRRCGVRERASGSAEFVKMEGQSERREGGPHVTYLDARPTEAAHRTRRGALGRGGGDRPVPAVVRRR